MIPACAGMTIFFSLFASPLECEASTSTCFSPYGGCTEAIVNALDAAKKSVLVQAFSFTSWRIAEGLVEAHRRGVKVEVILDKTELLKGRGSKAGTLAKAGIPISVDGAHDPGVAHNKVMVIDGQIVITGSFNFTNAAEAHNAENLLIIDDKGVADRYAENWRRHRAHSGAYRAPQKFQARLAKEESAFASTQGV